MYKLIIEDLTGENERTELTVDCLFASYHIAGEEETDTQSIRAVECPAGTLVYCYLDAKANLLKITEINEGLALLEAIGLADKLAKRQNDNDDIVIDSDNTSKGRQ